MTNNKKLSVLYTKSYHPSEFLFLSEENIFFFFKKRAKNMTLAGITIQTSNFVVM